MPNKQNFTLYSYTKIHKDALHLIKIKGIVAANKSLKHAGLKAY